MDIIKVFGDNLKKYRTAMGISQEAFAEKCGMHRTYISAIECYRRSISLENIQRIADALGIEVSSLMDDNADFVIKATEKYGSRGHEQAERLIKEVSGLYAGGELAEEDMEAMMRAFQEAYRKPKQKNRKYVPKKYRGISESGSES